MTAARFLLTVASLAIEVLMGSSQVVNHLNPKWLNEASDLVLWALIQGEAGRAGINVSRIWVIDSESPNALTVASLTGGPFSSLPRA